MAERGQALEPLSQRILVERSLQTAPSGYLAIVSIIQGASFAFLAERLVTGFSMLSALQALAVLAVLLLVLHSYIILSILVRWAPSILDSFLPFAIGGFEVPPIFLLGRATAWSDGIACFWAVFAGGVTLTWLWTPPGHFVGGAHDPTAEDGQAAGRLFRQLLRNTALISAVTCVAVTACGYLAEHLPSARLPWAIGACAVTIAGVVAITIPMEWKLSRIYNLYGVPRALFN